MSEKTDEKIAEEVQGGNSQSFGVLVERYEEKLRRYAGRFLLGYEDAEDLVQDVFLKAYTNIQSFDTGRSFNSWIYRIAHNEFINAIKKRGKEPLPFFDPDTLFPHPLSKDRPDHDLNDTETKSMLDEFLGQIDAKYREPLILYYYEDMDYAGIADVMHIPTSTVGVRISRGKTQLQKIFKQSKHNSTI
jgi:RNA polymerase sigma-70 factor (ECF subfamily)